MTTKTATFARDTVRTIDWLAMHARLWLVLLLTAGIGCLQSSFHPQASTREVRVPAGTFQMGHDKIERPLDNDWAPRHAVKLSAFFIDRTEVTWKDFADCLDATVCATAAAVL